MKRVYVVGALLPRGGAFMAYHIGLLLKQEFGYEMVNVQVRESVPQFEYEWLPPSIGVAEMEQRVTDDDLLVINPSFSRFMFGLRLPGRKICYAQDFKTFRVLDCNFDLYVSVSTVVRDFLRVIYGIDTLIIPPFIQHDRLPQVTPWHERAPASALMYVKSGEENQAVAQYVSDALRVQIPQLKIDKVVDNGVPHSELMRRLGAVRYLINVSLAEGFGLIPLEAMALGTCVTGLDGLAGRDYMCFGQNSVMHNCKNIKQIPDTIAQLLRDEKTSQAMTVQARKDAERYALAPFRKSWAQILHAFLK